jgi:hypothetical protein
MKDDVFISQSSTPLRTLKCPHCGGACDGWTALSNYRSAGPKPGSITTCATCGNLLVFVASVASYRALSLRPATDQEKRAFLNDPDPELRAMRGIVEDFVQRRRGRRPRPRG